MFKPVFLPLVDNHLHLLERAEYYHCERAARFATLTALLRLFPQIPRAKIKEVVNLEIAVSIKETFPRKLALPVRVVTVVIPSGITRIRLFAEIVRDVGNDELRRRDLI